ncbi:MAG: hypothetical protein ABFR95_04675 [Actinomycetota bacterium]
MRKAFTIALVSVLLLSACAGSVDGPVIEGKWRSGGTDADVHGEVELEGNCLYLMHPDADERYPIVWPRGTSWDADESAVRLRDGTLVYPGDTISGGGGFPYASRLDDYTSAAGRELAGACVDNTHDEIAVFNSGENLEVQR